MTTSAPTPAVAAPAAPPASGAAGVLDRSLVRGIAWTGGVKWLSQLLTWGSTLLVARILTPVDYGIVGMAAVFTGLVALVSEFGLGSAVVSLRTLDGHQVRQLNTVSVLSGVVAFALTCAAALPFSRFFGTPELARVLVVLGTGFVVAGFRTVPEALLQKELRFRTLAVIEGGQATAVALATVALAWAGTGYWTLVGGMLLGGVLSAAMAVARRPQGFARPRAAQVGESLTFSWHLLVQRMSWYAYSNADFAVVGRVLGQSALGAYSFAWSLASIPIGKVSGMILRVTPAYFSAVQHDRAALRRYFLTLTEGVALLTLPATVGIALVADDFVVLLLGEKWRPAVAPLRLLALYAALRSLTPLLPQVLTVTGDNRYAMRNALAAAAVLPVAFVVGTRWGAAGVAAAWMVAHPLVLLPLFRRVFLRLETGPGAYLRALLPALAGCAVMALCVWGAAAAVPFHWPPRVVLALEVLAGAAGYTATVLLVARERLRTFLAMVRSG